MDSDKVELRKKPLRLDVNETEKYYSGGGTPDLELNLRSYPRQFNIKSKGTTIHGAQTKVDYALIRTKSFNEINIVRKKERNAGDYSLNNEVKKCQSIKQHANYEEMKTHLSLLFHSEPRNSGMEAYSRLKINGDLESHSHFIQNNSSSDECINYIFHQTRNIVKTLNFLHNGDFLDDKEKKHKGIIHGDIKPDNILMDKNGDLSLSDFGCARYVDESIEQPGLVTYLSPELLKIYAGKIPSSSDPGKSDIWSLGLTLQSTLTGKCPIESYSQTAIDSINSMSKDTNGYIIREIKPTLVDQEVYTEKLADMEKLSYPGIEQEPPQVQQIRIKVDKYLQSEICKKNLGSKKIIQDLCQNSSHAKIDKRIVLGHLTSSMLLPEEQRPTAKNLSETMDKLAHYFPYDQKNNFEFVKRMTGEKRTLSLNSEENIQSTNTPVNLTLDSNRLPYKKLLDQVQENDQKNNFEFVKRKIEGESMKPLISKKENIQSTNTPVNLTLSSNRVSHKELLDKGQGATSVLSFLYSNTTDKNKTEKNKTDMAKKIILSNKYFSH